MIRLTSTAPGVCKVWSDGSVIGWVRRFATGDWRAKLHGVTDYPDVSYARRADAVDALVAKVAS